MALKIQRHAQVQRRTTFGIDDRRAVMTLARGRDPKLALVVPHEAFIRNALKDRMGWPRKEPASEELKAAAREMAAHLVARDKADAMARRAKREQEEKEAAEKHAAANKEAALAEVS